MMTVRELKEILKGDGIDPEMHVCVAVFPAVPGERDILPVKGERREIHAAHVDDFGVLNLAARHVAGPVDPNLMSAVKDSL